MSWRGLLTEPAPDSDLGSQSYDVWDCHPATAGQALVA